MTATQAVVAELLRVCCEEDDVKAMKMAFERILGKPEQVLIIKRMTIRVTYPEATAKQLQATKALENFDETASVSLFEGKTVLDEMDAPGTLLRREVEAMGETPARYAYDVIENKEHHTVAHVFAANVFAVAMRGGNLGAIGLLFDYLDGAVADVVRISTDNIVLIENYADEAPYNARQGEDGIYYVEMEAIE